MQLVSSLSHLPAITKWSQWTSAICHVMRGAKKYSTRVCPGRNPRAYEIPCCRNDFLSYSQTFTDEHFRSLGQILFEREPVVYSPTAKLESGALRIHSLIHELFAGRFGYVFIFSLTFMADLKDLIS